MKPIVVPVNFSENSANAARYAADLALSIGAEIQLLYIFQIPMSMSEVPMPERAFEDLQGSGREMLDNLSHELFRRSRGKLTIHSDMEIGTVEGQIEKYCKEKEPLLVVMGATGGGLENVLTGSNSVRAVRHLPYPVLVVPEGVRFQSMRYVVVACDQEDLSAGLPVATPVLQLMGNMPGIRLEVVHVLREDESASEFTMAYNHWKSELTGLQPALRIVRAENITEGMSEFLEGCGADLLVVFPKKHNVLEFHRSQAKRLVMHCAVPVMSIHE
ncbi:MAG TPA: universal stress protein [Puia sp.]|uniref:universal stress protein n=1 Tax=Puia sp. TaxID=2045100 RepID=UPI002CB51FD8|nr:universal stress protein [Puia sp.]HVU94137.1 universal stress protein [Puia sp.]